MSNVAITGNASGTGTFTIAAPNSNTDRTLTLPDNVGTILTSASSLAAANLTGSLPSIDASALTNIAAGSGAFAARLSAQQTIQNATWTKLNFTTATWGFDNGSNFNNSTGQYTVPVTGTYFICYQIRVYNINAVGDYVYLRPYINGNQQTANGGETMESVAAGWAASNNWMHAHTSGTTKLNAGDVVEARVYTTAGIRDVYQGGSNFCMFRLA